MMISKSNRNLIFLGIAITIVVTTLGFIYQHYERNLLLLQEYADLKAIAELKERQISHWVDSKIREAQYVANGPYVSRGVEDYLKNPNDIGQKIMIMERLHLSLEKSEFEEIFLTDRQGIPIISVGTEPENNLTLGKDLIRNSLALDKNIFTDFYLCNAHQRKHLDIIIPLSKTRYKTEAVLIFRLNPETYLFPLIKTWPTSSKTAETLLLSAEKDSIVFLNELRHRNNAAEILKIALSDTNVAGVQAALGRMGITEAVDYRGVQVLADLRKIKGTNWFLVSKIDKDEIFAEIYYRINVVVLFIVLLTVSILTIIATTYFYRQKIYYKELFEKEEVLRRSQGEFEATLYSIGDGVITTDLNKVITHMNVVAESLTGWSETEAKGKLIDEVFRIINEETRMKVSNPVSRVIRDGVVVGLANHTLLISQDGREIPIADSGAPILDDKNDILGVVLVFRDQTEERRNQLDLKESRDRFLSLFSNVNEGVALHEIIFDENDKPSNYRLIEVNPSYEAILEVNRSEIIGKLATEVYGTDAAPYIEEYSSVALKNERISFESYFPPLNKYFDISVVPWSTNGFATIFLDISAKKKFEQQIQKVNERWTSTFNSIQDPLALIDKDSNILLYNNAFWEDCKEKKYSVEGKKCHEVIHHQDHNYENCPLLRSRISGEREMMEFTEDGKVFSVTVDPIKIDGKSTGEYVHIVRDITDRVKSLKELEQLKNHLQELVDARTEELERVNSQLFEEIHKQKEYEILLRGSLEKEHELNELKTRFISTISHEFRTPLTSIYSSTELLERKAKKTNEEKYAGYTDRIKKSVEYLAKLLDEVIIINKAESGKIDYEPEWIDLQEFCDEIIEEAEILANEAHKFITNYKLDSRKYFLDRKLIKFIVSNLVSNACKYSPWGGEIEISVLSDENDLSILIRDTGIGIPEEDMQYLFEPFHRSKNCGAIPGTGLGLSIVKRSVELHHGKISVLSELNKGTQFTVKIPKHAREK